MNSEKVLSTITNIGAIVLATVGSFIISPPAIDPEVEVVNWHNVFVFAAGILGVVLSARSKKLAPKKIKDQKRRIIRVAIGIVILIALYEFAYYNFSRRCFDEMRIIIGTKSTLLPAVLSDYEKWKDTRDPIKSLIEAYQCEPQRIWPISWLLIPYWTILILYLAIAALVTFSISSIGYLLTKSKKI